MLPGPILPRLLLMHLYCQQMTFKNAFILNIVAEGKNKHIKVNPTEYIPIRPRNYVADNAEKVKRWVYWLLAAANTRTPCSSSVLKVLQGNTLTTMGMCTQQAAAYKKCCLKIKRQVQLQPRPKHLFIELVSSVFSSSSSTL